MVVPAAVAGDRQRAVGRGRQHQHARVLPVSGCCHVEEGAREARGFGLRILGEQVLEALELVEDHEVGLEGLDAGRREQAAQLGDDGGAPPV